METHPYQALALSQITLLLCQGNWLKMEWVMTSLVAQSTGYQMGFQSLSVGHWHRLAECQAGDEGLAEAGRMLGCLVALQRWYYTTASTASV